MSAVSLTSPQQVGNFPVYGEKCWALASTILTITRIIDLEFVTYTILKFLKIHELTEFLNVVKNSVYEEQI